MFNPAVGKIIMALAVIACVGSLLGWQFTLSQVSKAAADQRLFPQFFARINRAEAPIVGMLVAGVLQTLMALSTMSPDASAQFSKLVSLAAVTNIIPYVTALTGLMVIMHKAGVDHATFQRNVIAVVIAMSYSYLALYASGKDAVFGGMIVMAIGYLIYGFIAHRFEPGLAPAREVPATGRKAFST